MPCRATRCHGAAAALLHPPSAQSAYIWINDDLLAHAFSRFSRAVTVTTKRHGSNVPGPLEARRRLARRRVVGLANHAATPMPDMGSLFGTGPVEFGSLWKPPTTQTQRDTIESPMNFLWQQISSPEPVIKPPTTTTSVSRQEKKQANPPKAVKVTANIAQPSPKNDMTSLATCTSLDSIIKLHAILYPDGDVPLEFSRAAFQQLLANATLHWERTGATVMHHEHLQDISNFLQHELNHDLSRNMLAYFLWFKDKNIPPSALTSFVDMVCDKIVLSNMPRPEVHDICKLLSSALPGADNRSHLLTYAYTRVTPTILQRLPAMTKTSHRYRDCASLLQGLAELPPSSDAASLIVQTFQALSFSHRGHCVPLVAQCLLQWLHTSSQQDSFPVESTEAAPAPVLQVLNNLNSHRVQAIIMNVTARLMTDELISLDRRKAIFPYWLYLLRRCTLLKSEPWNSDVWSIVYSFLFKNLSPVDIDAHLAALGAVDAARVILHYWVRPRILKRMELPRLKALNVPSPHDENVTVSYTVSHSGAQLPPLRTTPCEASLIERVLSLEPSSQIVQPLKSPIQQIQPLEPSPTTESLESSRSDTSPSVEPTASSSSSSLSSVKSLEPDSAESPKTLSPEAALIDTIEAQFEARVAAYNPDFTPELAPYADLVAILHHHKQNHHYILNEIMMLFLHYQPVVRIYTLAMTLLRESIHIPPAISIPLIQLFIDTGNAGYALRIYQACPDAWLSMCPSLIFALIDNGPIHSMALFELLNRPEYANSLPTSLRSQTPNPLSEQRIHLLHHMAYALATSPHLTPRQSFRRVQDCIQYLSDRQAPLLDLISRALVQSGVIRPLKAGMWVSDVKFAWILKFVREYEGDHVADLLDRIAFKWRSENAEGLKRRIEHLYRQKEVLSEGWRRGLGHKSLRWKRRKALWRPWLADQDCSWAEKAERDGGREGTERPRGRVAVLKEAMSEGESKWNVERDGDESFASFSPLRPVHLAAASG